MESTSGKDPWASPKFPMFLHEGGERFDFYTSARTGPDHVFRLLFTLPPGKKGPNEHAHPGESETLELVSGSCTFWLDGVQRDCVAGDVVVIGPDVRHYMHNRGTEPAVMKVTYSGATMEDVFVPVGVGRARGDSAVSLFARMIVYVAETQPTRPSSALEVRILKAIASIFRLFGVRAHERVLGWDQA